MLYQLTILDEPGAEWASPQIYITNADTEEEAIIKLVTLYNLDDDNELDLLSLEAIKEYHDYVYITQVQID